MLIRGKSNLFDNKKELRKWREKVGSAFYVSEEEEEEVQSQFYS